MESIISFLIREIFIFPILFIMITGVLVVPFVTPVACAGWLVGSLLGKVPIFKTPVTFLLALYGVALTVGIWFMNPGIALIEAVANSPVAALGIPGLVMALSLLEQRRISPSVFWKRTGRVSSVLAGLALYWMALAATMSAAV